VTPEDHAYGDRSAGQQVRSGLVKVRYYWISHKITQSSRQLHLSVNRSGARLAISHPGTLQDIKGILTHW
jgi:hypothetical protein